MPSIYEGNLSKKMVKQVNRNTLAKKRADKLKKDKEKYPLPTVIKQGMNNTIKQSNASARAENNQRTMVTNLIMDKYKMPYDEAKSAYETILVPYQREQEKTAKRASFIGDKYNLDTLFTSKRDSPGLESARSLTNMLNPTKGKLEENPYFKQGVSMEGFLSTTNAGRAMSDPNANNRYRYAGDAAAGRADTPYNAPTFQQQFKDIKAAFEEDPRLMAEVVGMSLAQDFVKTALPIAASAVPGGAALANTEMGKGLNRGIMQFALDNAPVSDAAKYTVKGDWLADPTATSYIDPALLALSVGTGGVSGAFPITSKLVKAGKAVATSEKAATAGRVAKGAAIGTRKGLRPSSVGSFGGNFFDEVIQAIDDEIKYGNIDENILKEYGYAADVPQEAISNKAVTEATRTTSIPRPSKDRSPTEIHEDVAVTNTDLQAASLGIFKEDIEDLRAAGADEDVIIKAVEQINAATGKNIKNNELGYKIYWDPVVPEGKTLADVLRKRFIRLDKDGKKRFIEGRIADGMGEKEALAKWKGLEKVSDEQLIAWWENYRTNNPDIPWDIKAINNNMEATWQSVGGIDFDHVYAAATPQGSGQFSNFLPLGHYLNRKKGKMSGPEFLDYLENPENNLNYIFELLGGREGAYAQSIKNVK
jgi:hypothetical protein